MWSRTAKRIVALFLLLAFSVQEASAANVSGVSESPDPFNPNTQTTTLSYTLTSSALLWTKIYDGSSVLKRKLVTPGSFTATNKSAGANSDVWNGRDDANAILPNGTYSYTIDDAFFSADFSSFGAGTNPHDVAVDPSNPNTIWMLNKTSPYLYKSTNGGTSFSGISGAINSAKDYGIVTSSNGQIIYIAIDNVSDLTKSTNGGGSWTTTPNFPGSSATIDDVATDSTGNIVYALDYGLNRIYKSTNGGSNWSTCSATGMSLGGAASGIATDATGNTIIVADSSNDRLFKSSDGCSTFSQIAAITSGTTAGQVNFPYHVSIQSDGKFWVSERDNHRIQQFDANGNVLMTIGGTASGSGNYQFNSGTKYFGIGLATISGQPYIFVADYNNVRIKKIGYDNIAAGTITLATGPTVSSVDVTASTSGTPVANGVTQARQTDTIRINGTGFGATQGTSTVTVNGASATVSTSGCPCWSDTAVKVDVPNGTNTGNIVVTVGGNPSNNFAFTILPRITSFTNNTEAGLTDGGRVSQSVTFNGDHFDAAGTATIGSSSATVGTWTNTAVTITLPNDAGYNPAVVLNRTADSRTNQTYTIFLYPRVTSIDITASSYTAAINGVAAAWQTDTIRINGDHLGTAGTVTVNGTAAGGTPTFGGTATSGTITGVIINGGTVTGNVVVTRTNPADNKTSGASSGTFTLRPRITQVDVTASTFGTTVVNNVSAARQTDKIRIIGDHFDTTGTVTVNGAAATVGTWGDTEIVDVDVPNGTITGNIVVTVGGNTSNNKAFTILPRMTSLSPSSGAIGTSVNINGDHFGADPGAANRCIAANNVTFNATQSLCADVTSWSDTVVVSKVPTGATTGNVAVTFNSNPSNGVTFTIGTTGLQSGAATGYADSATSVFASAPYTGDVDQDSTTAFAVDTASNGSFTTVACAAVTGASPRTCSITGLTTNTPYWVKVTHTDPDGVSGTGTVSGNSISQVIGPFTPSTKILVAGQATATVTSTTSITVSAPFTGDTGGGNIAGSTTVAYSLSSSGPWTSSCTGLTGLSPRSCAVSGLNIGTNYFFQIAHTDADGVGGVGTVSGTTITQVIGPFSTLTHISGNTISLSPFNPDSQTTSIQYNLANGAMLWTRIYDSLGVLKKNVVKPANSSTANKTVTGAQSDTWNGTDEAAAQVADADYTYQIDDTAFLASFSLSNVKDVAVVQSNPSLVWAVVGGAGPDYVFKSTNGGSSFTAVSIAGIGSNLTGIDVSSDGTKIYFIDKTNNVYRFSSDSGSNWSSSNGGLTLSALNDIACNVDCTTLFMVESTQLYRSTNGGTSWSQLTLKDTGAATITPTNLTGVAISFDGGLIALADKGANKVYKCDQDGNNCITVASNGTADGAVTAPTQVLIGGSFYIWVADGGSNRIQEFDPDGKWLMTIGGTTAGAGNDQFSTSASGNMGIGGYVANDGEGQGYVYVSDFGNNRILKYAYDNISAGPIVVNHPPSISALAQTESDGTAVADAGTTTESGIVLKATVTDTHGHVHTERADAVRIQVEVRATGVAFSCIDADFTGSHPNCLVSSASASGTTPSLTFSGGNGTYKWRARGIDAYDATTAWVEFESGAAEEADFTINDNPPALPSSLAMRRCTDGACTTVDSLDLTAGGTINESKIQLRGVVSDPGGDTVKLLVEVKKTSENFACNDSSAATCRTAEATALVASGSLSTVVVTDLTDGDYKWQARTLDKRGRLSNWLLAPNVGGISFTVANRAPNLPSIAACPNANGTGQFKDDGITCIADGGSTNISIVQLKGRVSDLDLTDTVKLQVEVKPVGTAFTCNDASAATCFTVESVFSAGNAAETLAATISGLADGDYHWQARAIDDRGKMSNWISYKTNPENPAEIDFRILKNPPNAPSALAQRDYNNVVIALAGTVTVGTVKFEATVSDPDPNATVKLRVEVCPSSTPFNAGGATAGCPFFDSSFSANNAATTLSVTANTLANGAHHWRAKAINNQGGESAWVNAPENASNISFTISDTSSPNAIADLKVYVDALGNAINLSANSVTLTWTAPGNNATPTQTCPNGIVSGPGTAASYDIRYSTKPIVNAGATATEVNFDSATQVPSPPVPKAACTIETITVTGLDSNTAYYFAVKVRDGEPGHAPSAISNVMNKTSHPFDPAVPLAMSAPNPPLPVTALLNGLNLVSFPLQPAPSATPAGDINTVLRDDVGDPIWLFRWLSSGSLNTDGCWLSSAGSSAPCNAPIAGVTNSLGYFLMFDSARRPVGGSYLDAPGTLTPGTSASVALLKGWNMIGNPYEKEVLLKDLSIRQVNTNTTKSFKDAITSGWVANAIYRYEGSTYLAETCDWSNEAACTTALHLWKGYWLQVTDTNPANSYQLIVTKP